MTRRKTVDEYIESAEHWQDELRQLRKIVASTDLEETVKWGAPCYTYEGKNVVGIGAFKSYVGLWFHQGALLTDPEGVLINAQEGKTKAQRQWRFTAKREIKTRAIKAYIAEAIEVQAQGKAMKPDRAKPVFVPPELEKAFRKKRTAQTAFQKLTKGKQREYAEYIADAKRAETKLNRIEKIIPMITAGRGLNDQYR